MGAVIQQTDRIAKLAEQIQSSGADAFLAWHPISMGYLHGFREGSHERLMVLAIRSSGEVVLICPALSQTQARRAGIQNIRSWKDGEDAYALFADLADQWDLRTAIILVDDELPAHMLLRMQEVLPAALFKPGQQVLSRLMRYKDEQELDMMKRAAVIADRALDPALKQLKTGMSEKDLAEILKNEMSRHGGTPTFCIVATGANSAEPHHETDDTEIKPGDVVLLDYGCSVSGYNSDTTRVVCFGEPSTEAKKVYDVVFRAQEAGRDVIRAGVPAQEIDRACRKVIQDAGYGDQFVHRTGHGIGLRGHEDPYIVEGNDHPVEIGDCFSVEPGIYLPGKFGVRIENIVTPTENGHDSFNEEPPSQLSVIPV